MVLGGVNSIWPQTLKKYIELLPYNTNYRRPSVLDILYHEQQF